MKCGTPVIVGNRTSLPEVVGDAGISIDPFDVDGLALAIERVIADTGLQQQLTLKGLERARLFSWQETARRTLAVYQQVVQKSTSADQRHADMAS
jgi:glycosyltransferase involved in cell wall biosynthesis